MPPRGGIFSCRGRSIPLLGDSFRLEWKEGSWVSTGVQARDHIRDPGQFLLRRVLPTLIAVTVVTAWLRWYANDRELIDDTTGVAVMTVFSIGVFTGLSFWSAAKLRAATSSRRQAERNELYRTIARNYPGGAVLLFDPDL